ncbi:hypothetical protein SAMN02745181_0465 [Rubritalea squalenifaciens DSM 18772]|uniref:Uncharacterized protein n=1 Tax=Rubritalea squalenifaciens DSM 18772 TaxID=1123071 RepID=A0A1M6CFD1_9BACT|nr:hypothetical protein SAMN02745181_0465 [Rubritalea squalenifaciens DSM 18772]
MLSGLPGEATYYSLLATIPNHQTGRLFAKVPMATSYTKLAGMAEKLI